MIYINSNSKYIYISYLKHYTIIIVAEMGPTIRTASTFQEEQVVPPVGPQVSIIKVGRDAYIINNNYYNYNVLNEKQGSIGY